MNMTFSMSTQLPKLAWLGKVHKDEAQVDFLHGEHVEHTDSFLVEGAWNGRFADGDFGNSDCVFGTGAIASDDSILFVAPASTTDCIYWHQTGSTVTVSNSLPLLLAEIGDELDPSFRQYNKINESIKEGIFQYSKVIPTLQGSVNRLIYHNLLLTLGSLTVVQKPNTPSFSCFQEYYDYLRNNYAKIVTNARDPLRSHPLKIYSTQSRGYDSTAVNSLAKEYGIDKAFTVSTSKGAGTYVQHDRKGEMNDDGTEIGNHLGLKVAPIERRAFEHGFTEEYIFHSAIHSNEDANFLSITRQVSSPCLLLTGTLGEIWYPESRLKEHSTPVDDGLGRWDLGCHGLSEIRLSAGFIQLPVPFIGARRKADIVRITESEEMDPWRIGTDYDRPIPRRIAEQAGVPRELFGQRKMASVAKFPTPGVPHSTDLKESYFEFLVQEQLLSRWQLCLFPLIHRVNTWVAFRYVHAPKLSYYFERIVSRIIRRRWILPTFWRSLNGTLYCYCVNKRAVDYRALLR
ncbi:hypothetical protein [Marinobacter confluentis]|uniref:Asparagine synthetase domain-containing protein n=1 Tax=Marinobacter confluentis TaxID=1697557 RepID=A0A4Z1BFK7_9GAMM|nr:hypothetical protein [Marinobacter confluentis]TGN41524.1 hypothetical protein E5Q11_03035 [Marinobacter confluentis]